MDSKEVTLHLGKYLFEHRHTPICANFQTMYLHECDIISIDHKGFTHEFEIKISKSDFKADFKKEKKHATLEKGPYIWDRKRKGHVETIHLACSFFSYACPAGLISRNEVPAYAGLIWVHGDGRIEVLKDSPQLHRIEVTDNLLKKIAHNLTQKHLFGKAYMTLGNDNRKAEREEARRKKVGNTMLRFRDAFEAGVYDLSSPENMESWIIFLREYNSVFPEAKHDFPRGYDSDGNLIPKGRRVLPEVKKKRRGR